MKAFIRLASERDAGQIQAIYAPIVRHTITSFELPPPQRGRDAAAHRSGAHPLSLAGL